MCIIQGNFILILIVTLIRCWIEVKQGDKENEGFNWGEKQRSWINETFKNLKTNGGRLVNLKLNYSHTATKQLRDLLKKVEEY